MPRLCKHREGDDDGSDGVCMHTQNGRLYLQISTFRNALALVQWQCLNWKFNSMLVQTSTESLLYRTEENLLEKNASTYIYRILSFHQVSCINNKIIFQIIWYLW